MPSYLVTRLTNSQIGAYTPTDGQVVYNTTNGQFQFRQGGAWSVISGGFVTNVATGTGLTGGPVTSTGTISLANTAVTAGSYTYSSITVDAQGRLTAASTWAVNSGGAQTVGAATLNGTTGVLITTTAIATTSIVLVARNTGTSAPSFLNAGTISTGSIIAGTSFRVYSSNALDNATVNWLIINP